MQGAPCVVTTLSPLLVGTTMDHKSQNTEGDSSGSGPSTQTVQEVMDCTVNMGASTSQEASADLTRENSQTKRLSGAQRKKLVKAQKIAAGTWTERKPRSRPLQGGGAAPAVSSKRPQSGSPTKPNPKRARNAPAQTGSYRDAMTGIRMAVINANHPDTMLNQAQADLIQNKLVAAIDAIPVGEASPRFQRYPKFEGGILSIACADPPTENWLVSTVRGMEELGEGVSLTVVNTKDLPKRPKFLVWVPEPVEEAVVRSRLEKQNAGLSTVGWLLMSRKVEDRGQTLAYSLDDKSAKVLEDSGFKLYFSLGRVTFKKLKEKGRSPDPDVEGSAGKPAP